MDRTRLQLLSAAFLAVCVGSAPRVLRIEPSGQSPSPLIVDPPAPIDDSPGPSTVASAGPVVSPSAPPAALPVPGSPSGAESDPPAPLAKGDPNKLANVAAAPHVCPPNTFIDEGACVTLPSDESFGEDPVGAPEGESVEAGHHEKNGKWLAYQQIPRRPDRPAEYDAYQYPIPPGLPNGRSVVSGYDLDLPDALQRRGKMRAVGHGAVDLPQKKGTPIRMLALDHQVGDARVIHVGKLMGYSVVTVHTVREGGRTREYVLIFGHLAGAAPGLKPGDAIGAGGLVGFVGDSDSPELVHLHLEARRVRDGVDGQKLLPGRILLPESTIVCDPRNVLPLKGAPAQPK